MGRVIFKMDSEGQKGKSKHVLYLTIEYKDVFSDNTQIARLEFSRGWDIKAELYFQWIANNKKPFRTTYF